MPDFDSIPMVAQPKELDISLYPHQLASVYRMEQLEHTQTTKWKGERVDTTIGVNADDTGYGKTLSMVALILRNRMSWVMDSPYVQSRVVSYAEGRIKKYDSEVFEKVDATLVLVSPSILHQWEQELWYTPLTYTKLTTQKSVDTNMITNYDVILVVPTMFNRLMCRYPNIAWKRFVFDEPGHLKIPAMKNITAGFTWLVTATPNAILYRYKKARKSFLHDLVRQAGFMDFEDVFQYLIVKNPNEFIRHSFAMPTTNHLYHACTNPLFNVVSAFVSSKLQEMISAGNMYGVVKALGGTRTSNVVELLRQKKQEELADLEVHHGLLVSRDKIQKSRVVQTKINRVNQELKELDSKYTRLLEGDCSICHEKITKPVLEPNCQNVFCGKCLLEWFKQSSKDVVDGGTCPLCRRHVTLKSLVYIQTEQSDRWFRGAHRGRLTKPNKTLDLIKQGKDKKFIVYSSWDETFPALRRDLQASGINCVDIKGDAKARQRSIDQFKTGDVQVVLLNSRQNGAGINLQEATDIIIYHEMSATSVQQIIGRANRIGRQIPLTVHHLQIEADIDDE